jgi:hypothetical protein
MKLGGLGSSEQEVKEDWKVHYRKLGGTGG